MATLNPFGLLCDDDAEEPSLLIAAQKKALDSAPAPVPAPASTGAQTKKGPAKAQPEAKLPNKPLPPAQAVRESRNEGQRRGRGDRGRGGDRGVRGRGGRGYDREMFDGENAFGNSIGFSSDFSKPPEGDGEKVPAERRPFGVPRGGGRGSFRAGRGDFTNGEAVDGRRVYDRRSGTGRGYEFKREGAGRGNWGTPTDDIVLETEEPTNEVKNVEPEKEPGLDGVGDANKDASANQHEDAAAEDKEMTLEEYEKVLEEKKKALPSLKTEGRRVGLDKELESMQLLSTKKNDNEVFIKLVSDKDRRKDFADKAKKSLSINEFLKPADGESYYRGGGRGRGRGRGGGRGDGGGDGGSSGLQAPAIEDAGQFPSLGVRR